MGATWMAVSGSLSASKLVVGWIAHSTAVFADGLENAGDLFGSGLVLYAERAHLDFRVRISSVGEIVRDEAGSSLSGADGQLLAVEIAEKVSVAADQFQFFTSI